MDHEITIIIADDHPIVRQGLRELIEEDPLLHVVAEAGNGVEAIDMIERLRPQIAVIDVDMPGLDGFGVARELSARQNPARIVFLTIHKKRDLFLAAIDLGVGAYILKDSAVFEIVNGIKSAAAGERFVSPPLGEFLLDRRSDADKLAANMPGLARLTPTETRVLRLLANYKSSKEIAAELSINYRTVENHRTNICQKLNLSGHNALLKFAVKHKSDL